MCKFLEDGNGMGWEGGERRGGGIHIGCRRFNDVCLKDLAS